jgi:hypothetical protein
VREDDERHGEELEEHEPDDSREAPPEESPPEERPESPVLVATRPTKQWRSGPSLSRWTTYGCAAGVLVLIVVLILGVALTKRMAWAAMDRSQRRLMAAVEQRNQPGVRMRTRRNIDRFRTQLRVTRDPYPKMGEFMKRVQAALEDGELSDQEIVDINEYLESILPAGERYGMEP